MNQAQPEKEIKPMTITADAGVVFFCGDRVASAMIENEPSINLSPLQFGGGIMTEFEVALLKVLNEIKEELIKIGEQQ